MEEADLLCDKIAIMAEGSLAAYGSAMDLKRRFGVGYRMTIVKQRSGSETTSPARQGSSSGVVTLNSSSILEEMI